MMSLHKKVLGSLSALALAVTTTVPAFAEGPSVSGFIDFGYNFNTNGQETNPLRGFDANSNTLTLQNAKVSVGGKTSDVTYQVDVMYGFDASLTHSAGFITQPVAGGVTPDPAGTPGDVNTNLQIDLEQAFISMPCPLTNGTVTVGKFVTPFGAEVIEAKDNFNTSRGFLFNYAIPFTHTGLKYGKSFGDLSLTAGVVNGWDNMTDNNSGKTALFQAAKPLGDMITVVLGGAYGAEQATASQPTAAPGDDTGDNGRSLVDALVTFKPSDKLTIVGNYDWGVEEGLTTTGTSNWAGLAVLAKYAFTDMFAVAARYENFDDEGSRTGTEQVLHSGTVTLECKKNAVTTRLEFRHDDSSQKSFVNSNGVAVTDQSTIGLQWLFSF